MDMRSLATVGLGYLFANDARFEGVTASTLGLNGPLAQSQEQRSGFDDLQRRHSNSPLPGTIGGQRGSATYRGLPGPGGEKFLGSGSLFSSNPGDRKAPFSDQQDDDWLEQQQRRRSVALADEIIGFDDNTEDARFGFSQVGSS
jgi:hypothetical protein